MSVQQKNLSPIFQKLSLVPKVNKKDISLRLGTQKDLEDSQRSTLTIPNVDLINGYSKIQELKLVKIGLASSEQIIRWAEKLLPNGKVFGEVLNANTLHYKTFKPHKGGLFCERVFGPLKDFECACGIKQKPFDDEHYVENLLETKKIKRIFCSQCDVEYTWSVIRRYQLGYIQLAAPISHLWYLKTTPSYLSLLLDMQKRDLESIVYCMQITTLEYYWKPLYALQMNLDASALFRSYKTFRTLDTENKTNSLFAKKNRELIKKQEKESQKRKKIKIKRQRVYLTSTTIEKIESLKHESLQKQIQYLEKSFELSTTDLDPNTFLQTSNITRFLQQNVSRKIKKKTFLTIYQTFAKNFYTKIFRALTNRYGNNLRKLLSFSHKETNYDDNLESKNETARILQFENKKRNFSRLGFLLKKELQLNEKRKTGFQTSLVDLQQKIQFFVSNSFKHSIFFGSFRLNKSLNQRFDILKGFQEKKIFLGSLISFLTKNYLKEPWTVITIKTLQATPLFFFRKQNKSSIEGLSSLKRFLNDYFFLYLLLIIQSNSDSFLKPRTFSFYTEQIISSIRRLELGERLLSKKQKPQDLEFLSKFLQTNCLMNKTQSTINFFEIKTLFSKTKEPSFDLVNSLLQRWVWLIIKSRTLKKLNKRFLKKRQLSLESPDFKIKALDPQVDKLGHLVSNDIVGVNFQKTFTTKSMIFNEINFQKKSYKFLKNADVYLGTCFDSSKVMIRQRDVLMKKGKKINMRDVALINNLYTVAYSKGWLSEKDWKYFVYYSTSPIEITDARLIHYKHRFIESDRLKIPIMGAHFIEKILQQYEGLELKTMAKQTQMVLPKLNRYIRFRKQRVLKKIELIEIQKLLQKRDEMIRRLKLFRKLFKKNSKATSMILNTLPVLPPDLRPILKMQNQIAASDLNRFYQRILYRNDRLKKFLRSNGTWIQNETGFEIKYAHRLLQEAVDNLIQNGKGNVKPETNSRGQALKSLSEILKGKQGRFRQYLLGKRVDYSGRSVIVVGPKLKIYECGLPFEMAIELFLPFLIKKIFQYKLAKTIIGAKTILKNQLETTWNLLEEVMQNHPILLNRAPTLHRLGIQSFQPKLIEGRAILLHPLVCPAFNADFDGDQMAVHVPITVEARTEAWKLMFSRNHLISAATGEPMLLPSQDMVLGCYFLTTEYFQRARFNEKRPFTSTTRFYFANMNDVLQAYFSEKIHLQTPIWIKWNGLLQTEDILAKPLEIRLTTEGDWTEVRSKSQKRLNRQGISQNFFIRTTAGRVLFNNLIQNCIQNS
uniref:DNA-directed RNA polymerase subunit beta' n=1 Tax=Raphidocelis subcapitata TaxID=307507 RepID=A0A2Z6FBN5_9CHLO|nr:DNA-directed RNA polymerase subunit beta [Raphidocelis subcapitata]